MVVRIARIKVNRGGPLSQDFVLDPRDVNLIYGHNETGKTYVVESIISILFKTGKKAQVDWNLREWDHTGNIKVSGLLESPVTFTKTGKKIEDYWDTGTGLPSSLSNLLVVKSGETSLAGAVDGVGRSLLRDYLSGEGILDGVEKRISATLQKASLQEREIDGPDQGELKRRRQLLDDLARLTSLLQEAEEKYTSGEIRRLTMEQARVKAQLDVLEKAKRYYAFCVRGKRDEGQKVLAGLPNEEELAKVESQISVYDNNKSQVDEMSEAVAKNDVTVANYKWADKAVNTYREFIGSRSIKSRAWVLLVLSMVLVAAASIAGLFGRVVPLLISAAGSLVSTSLYYLHVRKMLANRGKNIELENLKSSFKQRFGVELADIAMLEDCVSRLRDECTRTEELKAQLERKLKPELKSLEINVGGTLERFTGDVVSTKDWRSAVKTLRQKLANFNSDVDSCKLELASLAITDGELTNQDPGIPWDSKRHNELTSILAKTTLELDGEHEKLKILLARLTQETGLVSTDFGQLIEALQSERDQIVEAYKQVTAEILAKVRVESIIKQLREDEDARICDSLCALDLTQPLYELTGRYVGIRNDPERGLMLWTDKDEEYALSEMSTGAQEQTFLALRIGFASIAMKSDTAFLILDDAFQHSDWVRRENLVAHSLKLASNGWQIFYFTMDDHIRDLFLKDKTNLGDRFTISEL